MKAETLLEGKELLEVINVSFPEGTLYEPLEHVTHGTLYKAMPFGTLTLCVEKLTGGYEYYLAATMGDKFKLVVPPDTEAKSK
jgi:hypothetical protein